jgi:hypothetical protein
LPTPRPLLPLPLRLQPLLAIHLQLVLQRQLQRPLGLQLADHLMNPCRFSVAISTL